MTCCDTPKNLRLYRAVSPTGQAVYCTKCGRAHAATQQEIDSVMAQPDRSE